MKIITLTLNPAFDVHCYAEDFSVGCETLARITASDAGGKGINISRALNAGGVRNVAFVVLGDENGGAFASGLRDSGVDFRSITVPGRIRENITVHTAAGVETRLSFSGFLADGTLLDRVLAEICGDISCGTVVTFTGRVPDGVSSSTVKDFLRRIKASGARLVIDSKSLSLADITEIKSWLIKPNGEEISEYLGRCVSDFSDVLDAARELCRLGVENVMVSLGERGAMLVCESGEFVATPPAVTAHSTVGAGDSTVAGFIAADGLGMSSSECLRTAVAYGTAACLTEGTDPPRREDISRIYDITRCEEL